MSMDTGILPWHYTKGLKRGAQILHFNSRRCHKEMNREKSIETEKNIAFIRYKNMCASLCVCVCVCVHLCVCVCVCMFVCMCV